MKRAVGAAIGVAGVGFLALLILSREPVGRSEQHAGSSPPGNPSDSPSAPGGSEISATTAVPIASLEAGLREPRDLTGAIGVLVETHKKLLSKTTRQGTLAVLREAWPRLSPQAKILVTFLVGGFEDPEISAFRKSLLTEQDPRVLAFVARVFLMDRVDEIEPAIADPEERLGIRLKGNPVPGFNAKGYPFFWECVFFEICESMPGGFPRPEFEEEFRGKHLPTGGAYKLGLMSAELRVYHECFERELQDPQVRDPLLEAVARLAPSEAKSVLFRILLDRSEVRIPADMLAICARMVVDAEENTLDRYFIVRMLRSTETPERVEVLRNAFFLEMSLQSPDYGIGIACEALEGLLSVEPGELSQNSATRHFALRLVAKAAAAEDLQNQFEVLVRAILSADVSVRTDLEALALSLASTSPSGAAKLKALLGEPIPAKK